MPSKKAAVADTHSDLLQRIFCEHNLLYHDNIHQAELKQLGNLVSRCVTYGESNSVLVVGPRGCGKTHLIKKMLVELNLATDSRLASVVHLNGLLQIDDNTALEEITRQLKLENVVDGMVFGSFEEKLQFLLQSLKSGDKESQPAIFIIDEFDLFTSHKNQTLLYNLFDISQSKQTPVCIIGLTCRLDVIELLEKRVKSRFSHRFIHLSNKCTYQQWVSLLSNYLKLPSHTKQHKNSPVSRWNTSIEELLIDPIIKDALLFRYNIDSGVASLKNFAALIAANLSQKEEGALPEQRDILEAVRMLEVDSKASMLLGISVLDLCLIISMKQLTETYSDDIFTFQMVYDHYKKFSLSKSSMATFPKAIALKAFEHLVDLEIIKPADGSSVSMLKQYRPMRLLVTAREIEDAVTQYMGCPSDVKQWAMSNWVH